MSYCKHYFHGVKGDKVHAAPTRAGCDYPTGSDRMQSMT